VIPLRGIRSQASAPKDAAVAAGGVQPWVQSEARSSPPLHPLLFGSFFL